LNLAVGSEKWQHVAVLGRGKQKHTEAREEETKEEGCYKA
jgi:hypothetical protein